MELTVHDYKLILLISSSLLALFVAVWVAWFLTSHKKPGQASRKAARPTGGAAGGREIKALTAAVTGLIDELNDTMNSIMARAEEKERRLKQLVSQAENKIKSLEAHMEALKDAGMPAMMLEEPLSPASSSANELSRRVTEDKGMHKILTGKYRQIFDLYDQGMTIDEISRSLSMEKGEIQLVFNLRRKL